MKILNSESVSWLLRFGFLPYPEHFSENNPYEGGQISALVMSDLPSKVEQALSSKKTIGTNEFSFIEFDKYFREAISKTVPKNKKVGVLLSGGKDSSALVYGLFREGYSEVLCYTFVPNSGEDESQDASILCNALGFEHRVIRANLEADFEAWDYVLSQSDYPCGDFAFPSVCRLLKEMHGDGVEVAIDGMGNDIYMGHVPPRSEKMLQLCSVTKYLGKKIWGKEPRLDGLSSWKLKYVISSVFMHPLERCFPGSRFSISELQRFGLPTEHLWKSLEFLTEFTNDCDEFETRALVRGVLFDDFCAMEKSRLASRAFGIDVRFPFCADKFVDYYNQLKDEEKFDKNNRVNKVALRKYLAVLRLEYGIGSSVYNEKKGSFRFNFDEFLAGSYEKIDSLLSKSNVHNSELLSYFMKAGTRNLDYFEFSKLFLVVSLLIWEARNSVDTTSRRVL
ncbi:MAG: hypothetical protein CMM07_23565 [Rhodopirellula sp.]|nr:hypothetical protein [Rhodopirellula sp.]